MYRNVLYADKPASRLHYFHLIFAVHSPYGTSLTVIFSSFYKQIEINAQHNKKGTNYSSTMMKVTASV
jgi:hypothetical protein